MASKKLRASGTWEFTVKKSGVLPKPLYLTFETEQEGIDYCANLEKLLAKRIVPAEFLTTRERIISNTTHAIESYLEEVNVTDDDEWTLGQLKTQLKNKLLETITNKWAGQWVKELRDSGQAPSTIRHKVGALARCLDWVMRREDTILTVNPLRLLPRGYSTTKDGRKDEERDRRLSADEEKKIRAILNKEKPEGRERSFNLEHQAAMILLFDLAIETAMRMREIYTLTADQINILERTIFLDKTKNGDNRQVPMSSVVVKKLTAYLVGFKEDRLFPFWDGDFSKPALRRTSNRLSNQWADIFSAAGCPDFRFHDIRHEATSRLFEKTDLRDIEISAITGHKSLQMLKRYSNLRASTLHTKLW